VFRDKPLGVGQKITRAADQVEIEIEREHDIYQNVVFRVRLRSSS
jgi:hypothetical protein